MGYSTVDVAELEGEGPGGAVRKVRRAVGGRAFGFKSTRLPIAGPEGLEFVAFGAPVAGGYQPPTWA